MGNIFRSRLATRLAPGAQTALKQSRLQTTVGSKKILGRTSWSTGCCGAGSPSFRGRFRPQGPQNPEKPSFRSRRMRFTFSLRQISVRPETLRCPSGLSPSGSAQPQTTLPSQRTTRVLNIQSQVWRDTSRSCS